MSGYRLDIKDTMHRLRHAGKLLDINEESNFVKLADVMLSVQRHRLDTATESIKSVLSDWTGQELDNWWGVILSLKRLPGIEDEEEIIGDPSYIGRIESFMQAANEGVSLESVRKAAEAGAGVPFRIMSTGNKLILYPLEEINAAQKQGVLRATYRIAPANCIIEIEDSESYDSTPLTNMYSPSVYIGEDPKKIRVTGESWNSPNTLVGASANKWGPASEISLSPGDGSPTNLTRQIGSWHVPNLGFGFTANLKLSLSKDSIVNRISFSVGEGNWRVIASIAGETVIQENVTGSNWINLDREVEMSKVDEIDIEFTNISQNVSSLFVRGMYAGARVNSDNRVEWLGLGGNKSSSEERKLVVSEAEQISSGGEWLSSPSSRPNVTREFYARRGGELTSAFTFKTRTPGAMFRVSYSWDELSDYEDYPEMTWIDMPGYYRMVNGRVDVKPFKGKYVKLTFTNLRPLLLREYQDAK